MNRVLALCLILLSMNGAAQIHRGIRELAPYFEQIDQLNEQLRSDPRHFPDGYQKLMQVSKNQQDSSLLSFLYVLQGSYHFYLNAKDSAIHYFEKSKSIAHDIGNSRIEIAANVRLVFCYEYEKSALELSRLMEENFKKSALHNDTINMIYSLNGLGLFFDRMDSTNQALKCHYWALTLSEYSKHKFEEAFVLNNLGLLKLEMGWLDSAYADFTRGLNIAMDLKDNRLECYLRENLGYYYMEIDSLTEARNEFNHVLHIGDEQGLKDLSLSSLINLAGLEQQLGNVKACDSLYNRSLMLAKEAQMLHMVSPVYLGLAQLYMQTAKPKEALPVLDSSLVYAEFSSPANIRLAYLQLKSDLLDQIGKPEEALATYKEFTALSDSLDELANIASIAEMQFQFNDAKREKQQLREKNKLVLQLKQQEVDLANFRQRLIIIIAFFVLILSGVLIYYYRLKQKNEQLFSDTMVNKLEEERGRIARDLHDGIGQSLIILKNKIHRTDGIELSEHEELNINFSNIIEEIRSISRSLIPPELKRLGLKKALESRLEEVASNTALFVNTEIDALEKLPLEPHQSLRIYRIVQELTTNTLKHAEATAIKIEAVIENSVLTLIYQDNGKGLERERWRSAENSVGLRSILQRLNYLNGTIKVDRPRKGFKVIMKIPLP